MFSRKRHSDLKAHKDRRSRGRRAYSLEALEPRLMLAGEGSIIFNEIMYNPAGADESLEWVELHNLMSIDMDLSLWQLESAVDFEIPSGTIVPGGGYLVIASDPAALASAGFPGALGPYVGQLSNSGENLRLVNNSDRLIDSLTYGDNYPWPVGPDGSGASLAKSQPTLDSSKASSWTSSLQIGGTPGALNFALADQPATVTSLIDTLGADWKYEDSDTDLGTDLGTSWRDPLFDDTSWASGSSPLFAGNVNPPPPLIGYWNFDDNVLDQSPAGVNDGTLFGATYDTNVPAALGRGKSLLFAGGGDPGGGEPDPFDARDVSGLVLWLDADASNLTKDGANRVSAWNDITGVTTNTVAQDIMQAESGRMPLWVPGAIGGRPAIRFDGFNDRLSNTIDNLLTPGGDRTIIVVGEADDAGAGGSMFTLRRSRGGGLATFVVQLTDQPAQLGQPTFVYTDGLAVNIVSPMSELPVSLIREPFVSVHRVGGGALSVDVNGSSKSLTSLGGAPSPGILNPESGGTGFSVGGREDTADGFQQWNGDIAEVLVFDRELTSTELDEIRASLEQKYSIGVPVASSDRVEISADQSLDSTTFTLSMWVNDPGQTTHPTPPGFNRLSSRGGFSFETALANDASAGGDSSVKFNAGGWQDTSFSTTPNDWVHLAFVYDGTTLDVYADGASIFSGPKAITPSGAMTIGANVGGGEGFVGNIDDVALWNAALPQSAIQDLAGGIVSPPDVQVDVAEPPVVGSPQSISGLALWLDAGAANVVKDGNNLVSAWNDLLGVTNNVVAQDVGQADPTRQPLWIADAIGGLPAIRFDGGNDRLGNTLDNLLIPGTDRTIIVVRDANDAGQGGSLVTLRRTGPAVFNAQIAGLNSFIYTDGVAVNILAPNQLPTIVDPFVAVHRVSGTTLTLDVNGVAQASGTIVNPESGATGFTIGGREDNPSQQWNGDIAEVIVYDRNLTPEELEQINAFLKSKYGLDGGAPLNTELASGPRTHYFRKEFEFGDDPQRTLLQLTPLVDDGAVFYLNGVEIYRQNLPAGPITHATLASSVVEGSTPSAAVALSGENLINGTNVLAVEVHQAESVDGDMLFALQLQAIVTPPSVSELPPLAFNEFSSGADAEFQLELVNLGDSVLDLAGFVIVSSNETATPAVLPAQTLAAGGFLSLTETDLGFDVAGGDKLFLFTPSQISVIDAHAVTNRLRGRSPGHDGRWLYPNVVTPGAANRFAFSDEIVINEIMYNPRLEGGAPDIPATFDTTVAVAMDSVWDFDDSGTDLGTQWREGAFTPTGSGQALIGFESATLAEPLRTVLADPTTINPPVQTYYFRKTFTFNGDPNDVTDLQLRTIIDDGAVFYLNGQELRRQNILDGAVDFTTTAVPSIDDASLVTFSGLPTDALVNGENILAVEVHQRDQSGTTSSDIVFGAELVIRRQLTPSIPGTPSTESNDQWIELYNRNLTQAVDLEGWSFTDGVNFTFAAGTTIAPGGYLVVPRDVDAFVVDHPGVAVVGNFSGKLSRAGERLELSDATGNPADEVEYYDEGRWPEFADGGGSSLELRDPNADNSKAQAWAASDESDASAWQTISYRGLATSGLNDPTLYNELVVGLLDAGEVLLDDIRVVADPDGAATELIQNGSFESDTIGGGADKWRILGTHDRSRIDVDPDDPTNQVLRVVATGSAGHLNNLLETTLKDGANFVTISSSTEYEISFRAKWIAGSNQLNTRLFFNRLARTTLLDVPELSGTPGAKNSAFESNIGPTYSGFRHGPIVPQPGQPTTVSVVAEDPDGVASMSLFYSVDGAAFTSVAMTARSGGLYTGIVPGQPAESVVQFYVLGEDSQGAISTFPAAGADSRALYKVEDGQANLDIANNFRIIMTTDDADFLHLNTNVMSNALLGATVVYNESEVFYDVGVRLRGSEHGRFKDIRVSFTVKFQPDQLFRGKHGSVTVDRSGAGDEFGQRQILIQHALNRAGDIPGGNDDLIRVITPRDVHTGSAVLLMSKLSNGFLDSQYENGSDGTIFKYELIYDQTQTTGGPEGLKFPQNSSVNGVPLQSLGEDKEAYRWHYLIGNNRDADDYSSLIDALAAIGQPVGDQFYQQTEALLDVDQWLRSYAIGTLFGVADSYLTGGQHNTQFYVRPEDGKVLLMPWDMDLSFVNAVNSSLTPAGDLNKLITLPANRRAYYGNLNDIVNTTFNAAYMDPWVTHLASFLPGQDFSAFGAYIATRSSFAQTQIPAAIPIVSFAIASADPLDVGSASLATLVGSGWVDVREIRLPGSDAPLDVTWGTVTGWQVTLPVDHTTGEVTLEAYDFQGELIGTDTITITSTAPRPILDQLRIVELMYQPAGDGDAEFIELQNISGTPIPDLGGVAITDGPNTPFVFPAATPLGAGERILVVRNQAAFEAEYGLGHNIAGVYSGGLSNGGEQIILVDAENAEIQRFTYQDGDDPVTEADWHPTTDGGGYSLVIIDPTGDITNWDNGTAWRPSFEIGGSPGAEDLMAGDANGDNRVSLVDLALVQANFGVNRLDAAIVVRNLGRFYDPPTPAPATAAVDTAHSQEEAMASSLIQPDTPRRASRPAAIRHRKVARSAATRVQRVFIVNDGVAPQIALNARRQILASRRGQRSAHAAIFAAVESQYR